MVLLRKGESNGKQILSEKAKPLLELDVISRSISKKFSVNTAKTDIINTSFILLSFIALSKLFSK